MGDLGSQGLGLLFLRFGRDAETQADTLGFRYMTRRRFDPTEMAEMFRTLDRTGGDERRTPQWLSTHPDPGNRVVRTQERIAAWQRPAEPLIVNREPFLRRLDGLVFGDDPQQGFFRQEVFFHPAMKFRLDFPGEWKTQNARTQVAGVSASEDAIIVLTIAGKDGPAAAARAFASQQGLQATGTSTDRINGLPAATVQFLAQTEQAVLAGYAAFVDSTARRTHCCVHVARRESRLDAAFRRTIGPSSA